jgi:hypothetical protein
MRSNGILGTVILLLVVGSEGLSGVAAGAEAEQPVHYKLDVRIDPAENLLQAEARISVPLGAEGRYSPITLLLHGGLRITETTGADLMHRAPLESREGMEELKGSFAEDVDPQVIELAPGASGWRDPVELRLVYRGRIHHPIENVQKEYARSFGQTPGIIDDKGVSLSVASLWFPYLPGRAATFELVVSLPEGWDCVSQGRWTGHALVDGRRITRWTCVQPMDDVYLVAGRYHEYEDTRNGLAALVYLQEPDAELARRYLDATHQYISMYSELIGPYPYEKFALVENFWETGYGMPSFTLLGPKVVRMPFIIRSSYPHEILHNWWGNSVFVDYEEGNWCEGLTAYLADHLMKEMDGKGAEYRRNALQRYADYVRGGKDFPLSEFRSRHSSATEAVGYGKSLMLAHMIRREIGDAAFVDGLRRFYEKHRQRAARFSDLIGAFSAASGRDLGYMLEQWVLRAGAPRLELREARVEELSAGDAGEPGTAGWRLSVRIGQEVPESAAPYRLRVPLAVLLAGQEVCEWFEIPLEGAEASWSREFQRRPLAVAVDPEFDLFRFTDRREIPPTLSQTFGAEDAVVVLAARAPGELAAAYRALAESWRAQDPEHLRVVLDSELGGELPPEPGIWIFGRENALRSVVQPLLEARGIGFGEREVRLARATLPWTDHAFVFTVRHPSDPDRAVSWLISDLPAALTGLGRKLPHYGKYGYLAFSGSEPTNVAKGQWQTQDSPLIRVLEPGRTRVDWRFPERAPLAELPPPFDAARIMELLRFMADDARQGRGLGSQALDEVAERIADEFAAAGLKPGGEEGGWFQDEERTVAGLEGEIRLRNVIGVIPGADRELSGQMLVIGAHYDHLGHGWPDVHKGDEGKIHNGADDNASGVAVLVQLARLFAEGDPPPRTLLFVAFSGEEAGRLGSQLFLRRLGEHPEERVFAMINLDTVGRLGKGKLYVLGTETAREWPFIAMGCGYTTGVQAEPVTEALDSSDQVSFIEKGIPAVQLFTGPHADYHRPSDDSDKIDPEGLVRITDFTREMIAYLAARKEPLTNLIHGTPAAPAPGGGSARKVSLGTMPDFAYSGAGYRIGGITPDSPAEKAGLKKEDVILEVDGEPVEGIRGFSELLKRHQPGDTITLRVQRGEEILSIQAELVAR